MYVLICLNVLCGIIDFLSSAGSGFGLQSTWDERGIGAVADNVLKDIVQAQLQPFCISFSFTAKYWHGANYVEQISTQSTLTTQSTQSTQLASLSAWQVHHLARLLADGQRFGADEDRWQLADEANPWTLFTHQVCMSSPGAIQTITRQSHRSEINIFMNHHESSWINQANQIAPEKSRESQNQKQPRFPYVPNDILRFLGLDGASKKFQFSGPARRGRRTAWEDRQKRRRVIAESCLWPVSEALELSILQWFLQSFASHCWSFASGPYPSLKSKDGKLKALHDRPLGILGCFIRMKHICSIGAGLLAQHECCEECGGLVPSAWNDLHILKILQTVCAIFCILHFALFCFQEMQLNRVEPAKGIAASPSRRGWITISIVEVFGRIFLSSSMQHKASKNRRSQQKDKRSMQTVLTCLQTVWHVLTIWKAMPNRGWLGETPSSGRGMQEVRQIQFQGKLHKLKGEPKENWCIKLPGNV